LRSTTMDSGCLRLLGLALAGMALAAVGVAAALI
jgi:hypothetical protein